MLKRRRERKKDRARQKRRIKEREEKGVLQSTTRKERKKGWKGERVEKTSK